MPTDPLAHWPDRTPLRDEEGRLVAVFSPTEHVDQGRRWADGVWRPDDVPVDTAADVLLGACADWVVSTGDEALASVLVSRGAQTLRHAIAMTHDFHGVPATASTSVIISTMDSDELSASAAELGPILLAAYPVGHPDHGHETTEQAVRALNRVAAGEVLGPLLPATTIARTPAGRAVGACLVVEREGSPPDGGPWVLDVFRDPASEVAGVGGALLLGSLERCRDAGLPGLSLVVSATNDRAHTLYERLGFTVTSESRTVLLPSA